MNPSIIDPIQAPEVPGLHLPHQFYWVLDDPAPPPGSSGHTG